jgi:hypothetical protein
MPQRARCSQSSQHLCKENLILPHNALDRFDPIPSLVVPSLLPLQAQNSPAPLQRPTPRTKPQPPNTILANHRQYGSVTDLLARDALAAAAVSALSTLAARVPSEHPRASQRSKKKLRLAPTQPCLLRQRRLGRSALFAEDDYCDRQAKPSHTPQHQAAQERSVPLLGPRTSSLASCETANLRGCPASSIVGYSLARPCTPLHQRFPFPGALTKKTTGSRSPCGKWTFSQLEWHPHILSSVDFMDESYGA